MRIIDEKNTKLTFTVAIVISRFNEEITTALYNGALERLRERGFSESQITCVWVPGAIEIPVTVGRLAQTGAYEAIITLGAVINGETRHFDYVCDQVSQGCLQAGLEYDIPVIFGVLTTNDEQQAWERVGGKEGHKGHYAVDAAVEMVSVLRQIG